MSKRQNIRQMMAKTRKSRQTKTPIRKKAVHHRHKAGIQTLSFRAAQGYPFGPQSRLSSLLVHREHLREEIDSQRRCVERLKKDMAECNAIAKWDPVETSFLVGSNFSVDATLERFLLPWLGKLQERLAAVCKDIEALSMQGVVEAHRADESVFELLRAVG
jgi:hypothetical protein